MTFRELLDKYRAGQASEEERAMVEAELEKSEAIADYLAEQVEDALGAAETQAPAGEVRHIQKKVNRRLRRTAVWAACIVLAVLLGGRFVVGPLVSSLYYQPNAYTVGGMEDRAPASLVKENGVEVIRIGDLPPEEVERHLRVESQDVAVDLTALYSLLAPGATVTAASAQPEGFGRYTLTVETEAWLTGETSQRSGELGPHADGFWGHSSPGRSILEIMESAESGRVSDKLEFSRHTQDYLRELPGTSYVAAWVHFPEHLNPVKLYWLEEQQEYSGIRFLWAGVRTGEESMLGFPMLDARGSGFSPDWEDYPMFNWAQASLERAVGVAYEQRFRSLLAYVNDRPQAIEALLGGEVWADYYQSYFAEAAAYVEANGVEVTGALVYAEADDLLRLWENGDVDKIAIDTVLPSSTLPAGHSAGVEKIRFDEPAGLYYNKIRIGGVLMKHVVITIGREYGSGGRLIAKQLSEELGITFYDKELITAVARKTGFSENFIRDSEHQRPTNSFLYDLYTAVQTPSVPDQVFIAQAKVIKEAASRESCVIVGRCADYILRDDPRRLSVFVHAPLDERVRRAREEYGVQEPNLEAYVLRQDRARASYYNYFATGKWGQSREYDLCVSSHMGIAAAVATIKAAALAVAGGTGA